jgi:hypothetical protein
MVKRWKKQKAGHQQSKQRKHPGGGGGASAESASGTMGSFRRGLRAIAGGSDKKGPKGAVEKAIDMALWAAVVLAAIYFFAKQCR